MAKKKGNKFNNVKKECVNGHIHDSVAEAERCNELTKMVEAGIIEDLETQVDFEIIPKFAKFGEMPSERATKYKADFVYVEDGTKIIEDIEQMCCVCKSPVVINVKGLTDNEDFKPL